MELAGDAAEHLLFAQERRRRSAAAVRPNLGQRREQLLGGLRGAMGIGECVQSVGHRFEFVFQCVDRRGEQLPERVASMRSNKITRIDTFWQGQNPQDRPDFFQTVPAVRPEFHSCDGGRRRRHRARA